MAKNPGQIAVFIRGGEVGFRVGGEVLGTERQVGIIDLGDNQVLQGLVALLATLDSSFTSIFEILLGQVVADLIRRRRENKGTEAIVWEIEVDGLQRFCDIPDDERLMSKKQPLAYLLGRSELRGCINILLSRTWHLLNDAGFFNQAVA